MNNKIYSLARHVPQNTVFSDFTWRKWPYYLRGLII